MPGTIRELCSLPGKIEKIIEDKERLQWFASKQANAKDVFFVGRGIDYAMLYGRQPEDEGDQLHSL